MSGPKPALSRKRNLLWRAGRREIHFRCAFWPPAMNGKLWPGSQLFHLEFITYAEAINVLLGSLSSKRGSLAFTNGKRAMASHSNPEIRCIDSNPGIHCNKERQMSARHPPRADLSHP